MAAQPIDHKQLLFNIAEYLQELKAVPGLVEEEAAESLDVATQCITSVFGLDITDVDEQKRYSFKPKPLPSIVGLGLAAHLKNEVCFHLSAINPQPTFMSKITQQLNLINLQTAKTSADPDLENKFQQYIQLATQKGYFNGVNPGTHGMKSLCVFNNTEYEQRYIKARVKFLESQTVKPKEPQFTPEERTKLAEQHKLEGTFFHIYLLICQETNIWPLKII